MKMRSMVITALYYIYIYTYIYFEGREWRNSQKTKTNEMSRALAPSLKPGPRLINDNFDSSSSCYHYTHFFFFLSSFLPLTTQCTKRCWKLCLRNGTRACNKRSRRVDSTSSKIKCQKIKAKKKKKKERESKANPGGRWHSTANTYKFHWLLDSSLTQKRVSLLPIYASAYTLVDS